MQFRRSGQRDERRRRVLMDERVSRLDAAAGGPDLTADAAVQNETEALPVKSYTAAALPERQGRITDLIPMRRWVLLALFLAGLSMIALLQILHQARGGWASAVGLDNLEAFDLARRDSLAAWYSSWMLMLAAVGAVMIYNLRRHKADDYRGRYKLWLWAALAWVLASMDTIAGLHHATGGALVHLSGTTLLGDGSIWWIAVYTILFAPLGMRMLFDVWPSRGAWAALLSAGGCYLVSAAGRLGVNLAVGDLSTVLANSLITMLAHLLLLLSVGIYARYVNLDAQGLIPVRPEKKRRAKSRHQKSSSTDKKDGSDEAKSRGWWSGRNRHTKIDPPRKRIPTPSRRTDLDPHLPADVQSSSSQPVLSSNQAHPAVTEESSQIAEQTNRLGLDADEYGRLSKAERRRLRKQMRRQHRTKSP